MEGIYGNSMRAWTNVLRRQWGAEPRQWWTLRELETDRFVATLSLTANRKVRLRARWKLHVPLDRPAPAGEPVDVSDEFPDPATPANPWARRLSQLPLDRAPAGGTYRLLAQLIAVPRDDASLQVNLHPSNPFPDELVTRTGANDDALLRGLSTIHHKALPALTETPLSAKTRFIQESIRGSRRVSRAASLKTLHRDRPVVLLTWRFRRPPRTIDAYSRTSPVDVRLLAP